MELINAEAQDKQLTEPSRVDDVGSNTDAEKGGSADSDVKRAMIIERDGDIVLVNPHEEIDDVALARDVKRIVTNQPKEKRMRISNGLMGLFKLSPELFRDLENLPEDTVDNEAASAIVEHVNKLAAPIEVDTQVELNPDASRLDDEFNDWLASQADSSYDSGEDDEQE